MRIAMAHFILFKFFPGFQNNLPNILALQLFSMQNKRNILLTLFEKQVINNFTMIFFDNKFSKY